MQRLRYCDTIVMNAMGDSGRVQRARRKLLWIAFVRAASC